MKGSYERHLHLFVPLFRKEASIIYHKCLSCLFTKKRNKQAQVMDASR